MPRKTTETKKWYHDICKISLDTTPKELEEQLRFHFYVKYDTEKFYYYYILRDEGSENIGTTNYFIVTFDRSNYPEQLCGCQTCFNKYTIADDLRIAIENIIENAPAVEGGMGVTIHRPEDLRLKEKKEEDD